MKNVYSLKSLFDEDELYFIYFKTLRLLKIQPQIFNKDTPPNTVNLALPSLLPLLIYYKQIDYLTQHCQPWLLNK